MLTRSVLCWIFRREELVTRKFSENWTALKFTEVNCTLSPVIDQEMVDRLKRKRKTNEESST